MFESISRPQQRFNSKKKLERRRNTSFLCIEMFLLDTTCHRVIKYNHKRFYGEEMHIFCFLNSCETRILSLQLTRKKAICYRHKEVTFDLSHEESFVFVD